MLFASFLVTRVTCVDAGKGDLPTVSDADFHRQTTPPHQTPLFPCVPVCRRVVDRTAPTLAVGEITSVQMI